MTTKSGSGQRIDCRQGLCSRLEFSRRTKCLEACQVSWRGRRPRHIWGDGRFSRLRFPTRSLIFDDVRFVGFWLDKWKRKQSPGGLRNAIEQVLQPLALTEIRHPVDKVFELDEFDQALARNGESRMGKVLLVRRKDSD